MGLFDTLVLDPAITCPSCGKHHDHVQTHLFGDTLSTWQIGSLIRFCPIHTGILKEEVSCCLIPGTEHEYNSIVIWIVIWHGIYAGHTIDENTATQKMNSIDRLDLLHWLDTSQNEMRSWRGRYRSLIRDLSFFQDAQSSTDVKNGPLGQSRRGVINLLPDEILNDPNPLKRIIEKNAEDQEPSGMFLDD